MKDLPQKFEITIYLDLDKDEFDVKVANVSERQGYVDMVGLKERLKDVMTYMQREGIDSLTDQLDKRNIH